MVLHLEVEQEADGRWIAEVSDLPGVTARRQLATLLRLG